MNNLQLTWFKRVGKEVTSQEDRYILTGCLAHNDMSDIYLDVDSSKSMLKSHAAQAIADQILRYIPEPITAGVDILT